jgi:hypothetical protein
MPSRGFLRAFVKSLKSTAKDPAAAVDSVVKRNAQRGSIRRSLR